MALLFLFPPSPPLPNLCKRSQITCNYRQNLSPLIISIPDSLFFSGGGSGGVPKGISFGFAQDKFTPAAPLEKRDVLDPQ